MTNIPMTIAHEEYDDNDDYTPEVAGLSIYDIAAIEGVDLSDYLRDTE